MADGKEYKRGFRDGVAAMEKELSSESNAEEALRSFGWAGRRVSVITLKTVLKEAAYVALKKVKAPVD